MVRVACMGAGGTGKTTFCEEVAKRFNMEHVGSASREVYKKAGFTHKEMMDQPPEVRAAVEYEIYDAYRKNMLEHEHAIFDRSPIDMFSYALLYTPPALSSDEGRGWYQIVCDDMMFINVLLYFPFDEFVPTGSVEDNFRQTDWGHRMMMDRLMFGMVKSMGRQFYQVPYGSVDSRVNWFHSLMGHRVSV